MKWIEKIKEDRRVNAIVIEAINKEIEKSNESDESVEELHNLLKMKRDIKMRGIDTGDVLKVVGNVAVVMVIVGFEMSNIMNSKASRFIKVM